MLPPVWPLPRSLATTSGISVDFSSSPYLDVSVQAVPHVHLWIQCTLTEYCSAGFPHSDIHGSMPICGSPWLFAACRVLLRLPVPRHSPCALYSLTCILCGCISASRIIRVISVLFAFVVRSLDRIPTISPEKPYTDLFQDRNNIRLSSIVAFAFVSVQFSRCKFFMPLAKNLLQCRISFLKFDQGASIEEFLRDASFHHRYELVGLRGLEPPTSRLSGVRSNHLSYKPI